MLLVISKPLPTMSLLVAISSIIARWSVSQATKDRNVKIYLVTGYIGMLSFLFKCNWTKLTCVRLFKHLFILCG